MDHSIVLSALLERTNSQALDGVPDDVADRPLRLAGDALQTRIDLRRQANGNPAGEVGRHGYPHLFTEGSLRWLIFHRQTNGFDRCVLRVGRRLYIDLEALRQWLAEHRGSRIEGS